MFWWVFGHVTKQVAVVHLSPDLLLSAPSCLMSSPCPSLPPSVRASGPSLVTPSCHLRLPPPLPPSLHLPSSPSPPPSPARRGHSGGVPMRPIIYLDCRALCLSRCWGRGALCTPWHPSNCLRYTPRPWDAIPSPYGYTSGQGVWHRPGHATSPPPPPRAYQQSLGTAEQTMCACMSLPPPPPPDPSTCTGAVKEGRTRQCNGGLPFQETHKHNGTSRSPALRWGPRGLSIVCWALKPVSQAVQPQCRARTLLLSCLVHAGAQPGQPFVPRCEMSTDLHIRVMGPPHGLSQPSL